MAEVAAELPSADVELGLAGGVAAPRKVVDDFGTGPELGPAGRDDFPQPPAAAVPAAVLRPTSIPDSDTDGPTDLPRPVPLAGNDEEISTDLSDHLAISASDVKDAVRASRVMSAVEMPADIAATLAAAEADQEARAAADKAAAAEKLAAEKLAAEKLAADKAAAEKLAAEKLAADKVAADKAAAEKAAAEKLAADKAAADKAAADKAATDKAAQAVVKPVEKTTTKPVEKAADKPTDKAATKPTDKAATKPTDKAATKPTDKAAKPVEPPAEPRTSRALIALLIITILLAGTYLVWTQLLKKPLPWEKAPPATTAATTPPTNPARPEPPPPPPPPPSSMLKAAVSAPVDVAAGRQGTVAEVVADGSTVVAGDVLVRFAANPGLTKQHAAKKKRLEVDLPKVIAELTAKRDAAQVANKPEAIKNWQEKLDRQLAAKTALEPEVASLTTQLDAFAVKAQLGGTVAVKVAKNAKVTKIEDVVASITAPTKLVAQFTPNQGKVYSVAQSVRVTVKATPTQAANCTVTAVEGAMVTVECPGDAGLVGDTEITLE